MARLPCTKNSRQQVLRAFAHSREASIRDGRKTIFQCRGSWTSEDPKATGIMNVEFVTHFCPNYRVKPFEMLAGFYTSITSFPPQAMTDPYKASRAVEEEISSTNFCWDFSSLTWALVPASRYLE